MRGARAGQTFCTIKRGATVFAPASNATVAISRRFNVWKTKAHFYLPRIWLQQNAETLTVTLNLSTDDSASAVNAFLAELNPAVELSAA